MSMENSSTLSNYFKQQYLEKGLQKVLPDYTNILSTVPFVGASEKAGSELIFPVITSREHGFTALGQSGAVSNLRSATVAQNRQARVVPYPVMGRTQIDTVSISRAVGGPQAFVDALDYKIENLQTSFSMLVEQELMYGQSGLGVIASGAEADAVSGGVPFTDGVNVAGRFVKIARAEFADHLWIGSEEMPVDIYSAAGALVYSTKITSYDIEGEYIQLESLNALAAMEGFSIFRAGFKENSGPGLQKILSHTSGTLFGIDSSTTPLWKASQVAVGGLLSFPVVAEGVARAVGRGLAGKINLHVHPRVFATLIPDFNTLKSTSTVNKSRMFTSSSEIERLEHGSMAIRFVIGSIELTLISNPLVKIGMAFGVADGELRRAGSTDITYQIPGEDKSKYFHRLPDSQGLELRVFTDQSLFSMTLNKHIYFSGITLA